MTIAFRVSCYVFYCFSMAFIIRCVVFNVSDFRLIYFQLFSMVFQCFRLFSNVLLFLHLFTSVSYLCPICSHVFPCLSCVLSYALVGSPTLFLTFFMFFLCFLCFLFHNSGACFSSFLTSSSNSTRRNPPRGRVHIAGNPNRTKK